MDIRPVRSVSLTPSKIRTVGFPQYGFKQAVRYAFRPLMKALTHPQWGSPLCLFNSVVGLAAGGIHSFQHHTPCPVALGSAAVLLSAGIFAYYGRIRASACQPLVYDLIPTISLTGRSSPIYSAMA